MEVLRRVTLQSEIPAEHRYPIDSSDLFGLLTALDASHTSLQPGAGLALGNNLQIYNKTGFVPGNDRLDHGLVIDNATGRRYLIALSLPEPTTVEADLSTLARHTLETLATAGSTAPALQLSSGVPMVVQLDDLGPGPGQTRSYTIWIDAPGADELQVWFDRWPLSSPTFVGPYFRLDHDFSNSGDRLMVVEAYSSGVPVGYRALAVHIN